MYEFWWVYAILAAACAVLYLLGIIVKKKFMDDKDAMYEYNLALLIVGVLFSLALMNSTGIF